MTVPRVRAHIPTSPGIAFRRFPLGGLFDFTFTTFFTARIVGALYVAVLLVGAGVPAGLRDLRGDHDCRRRQSLAGAREASAIPFVIGAALMLAGLVGAVVIVLCGRVVLELIVVTFRISETLTEIKARTK